MYDSFSPKGSLFWRSLFHIYTSAYFLLIMWRWNIYNHPLPSTRLSLWDTACKRRCGYWTWPSPIPSGSRPWQLVVPGALLAPVTLFSPVRGQQGTGKPLLSQLQWAQPNCSGGGISQACAMGSSCQLGKGVREQGGCQSIITFTFQWNCLILQYGLYLSSEGHLCLTYLQYLRRLSPKGGGDERWYYWLCWVLSMYFIKLCLHS